MKHLSDQTMRSIATYMDVELREKLHSKLCPCSPEEFLAAYCYEDPLLLPILKAEFGMELIPDFDDCSVLFLFKDGTRSVLMSGDVR